MHEPRDFRDNREKPTIIKIRTVTPFSQFGSTNTSNCYVSQYAGLSMQGYHPNNTGKKNQDSLLMSEHEPTKSLLFVCMDGHGVNGDMISRFVKKELEANLFQHENFVDDVKTAIKQVLFDVEKKLFFLEGKQGEFSGTTLALALVRGRKVVTANIGDSRIILVKNSSYAASNSSGGEEEEDLHSEYGHDSDCVGATRCRSDSSVESDAETDKESMYSSRSQSSGREKSAPSSSSSFCRHNSSSSNRNLGSNCSITNGDSESSECLFNSDCCFRIAQEQQREHLQPQHCRKRVRTRSLFAESLTVDHKPDLLHEYNRILKAGGRVFSVRYADGVVGPPRVWLGTVNVPGLAMSRSIGDFVVHTAGVVSTPDFTEIELDEHDDCMLIGATDGLWDHVSNEEVVEIASKHAEPNEAVAALIEEARRQWLAREKSIDDITVCVAHLSGL